MIACIVVSDLVSAVTGKTAIILTSAEGKVRAGSLHVAHMGVRIGMRLSEAHALCPQAAVDMFEETPYQEITEALADTFLEFTNKVELITGFWQERKKTNPALHPSGAIYYLDLGKLHKTDAVTVVHQIQHVLTTSFRLPSCIGLASGKFTASVAARMTQPDSPKLIQKGFEARFLSHQSISLLPLDKTISRRLSLLGIKTLGEFAALPADAILNQFGKAGRSLHKLAQGYDTRTVVVRVPKPKELIHKVFDGAIEDKTVIENILLIIGCELEERLQCQNLTTQLLELILHFDDKKTGKTKRVLREPINNGKVIGRNLLRLLAQSELCSGVTEIEVRADNLAPPVMQQLDLFGTPSISQNRLSDLLESLTTRFGNESLYTITVKEPDHWLPEHRFVFETAEVA